LPLIDITYPQGALTAEQRDELTAGLTAALLRAERAPDTDFFRSITWAYVHELPAEHVRAAGRPVVAPTFRVEATTPQGALSDRRRAEFVAAATRVVCEVAGIPEEEALRVWVLCHEVPEGSWGAAGNVVQFQQLAAAAQQAREQPATAS
jgi:phenylpyruvate tautomerase PptA (4-oxalocrotonate tautomerase family)